MPEVNESPVSWQEFLESYPPSSNAVRVSDVVNQNEYINLPRLNLYCPNGSCAANMFFDSIGGSPYYKSGSLYFFKYKCRHCGDNIKIYAIEFPDCGDDKVVSVIKFGELPAFGQPIPKKLLALLGNDKSLMFQGRQAENQGLGIGAFSYYRRIIENNWKLLLDKMIEVTKIVDPCNTEMIDGLEKLKNQNQFSQAVKTAAPAVPQALLIDGQNPLLLIHKALSIGIHGLTDEKCLEYATDVRVVLSELMEKMAALRADNLELKKSVRRLAQLK
ncbi:MAG: hypothetical protein F8N36_04860 [Desulfovibrio sp.]|uniref:hypothetical protein n=1 Tax=Desulfovibrio sp. TaxID=885 RepID=UPI00135D2BE1|nr:hypothetical protein [Desulfovibrio sp.]MTJ92181.1 hypothetical protein [Desulfovibrio sp.]